MAETAAHTVRLQDAYAHALGYDSWEDFCRASRIDPEALQVGRWPLVPNTTQYNRTEHTGKVQQ